MKFDDALKHACTQQVQEEDLSPERAEEMFSFIEEKVLLKKNTIRYKFIRKIKAFASSPPVISFAQVAAFILILILIPFGVKTIQKHKAMTFGKTRPDISSEKTPQPNTPADNSHKVQDPSEVKASDFTYINQVIEKGNVYTMSDTSNTGETLYSAYYTNRLDDFIDKFNGNIKASIFIVNYTKQGEKVWINKLTKLESTGSSLVITGYDPYSSKEVFIGDTPISFAKILKSQTSNGVRYAAYLDKSESSDKGMTLLSFQVSKPSDPVSQ